MKNTSYAEIKSVVNEWVEEYSAQMLSWALYKTSNREAAEDLVQETFYSAIKAFDSFKGKSSPKTWLFSILNNKIFDYHRNKYQRDFKTESSFSNDDERPFFDKFFDENGEWQNPAMPGNWGSNHDELLDDIEFLAILQECLEALPEKYFTCIQMKYLKEIEGKDICQELDITPTNYWQLIYRAKLKLRDCLENSWFDENV